MTTITYATDPSLIADQLNRDPVQALAFCGNLLTLCGLSEVAAQLKDVHEPETEHKNIKWNDLVNSGELEGYSLGSPRGGMIDGASIDQEIAESEPCDDCGGKMIYTPMIRKFNTRPNSYRAFAVCANCSGTIEF